MTQPANEDNAQGGNAEYATPSSHKRKRNSRACDRCHREGRKCSSDTNGASCARCIEQGVPCTYDRPARKRGPASHKHLTPSNSRQTRTQAQTQEQIQTPSHVLRQSNPTGTATTTQVLKTPMIPIENPHTSQNHSQNNSIFCTSPSPYGHHAPDVYDNSAYHGATETNVQFEDVVPPDILEKLVQIFYHTAYPLRPYFHWPTYHAQVQSRQYRSDWGLHIFTMAVCTMAAGRLCDGILMPTGPHPLRVQAAGLFSKCYNAAMDAIPKELSSVPDYYHAMKAKAILAAACLQNGDWKKAAVHLGDYASLSAMSGFCQEFNWPTGLGEIQKQERRRVFWGVYQQEQYISSNFGFASRQREVKAMVKYPVEVFDDDDITEAGVQLWSEHISFMKGFNFCTDLYRILERIEGTIRKRQQAAPTEPGGKIEVFFSEMYTSRKLATDSLHLVSQLYEALPDELKKPRALTGDLRADRYGFISCNVLLTTQTLRMLLVGTGKPNLHLRCAIASELLDELSTIPIAFFHASSTVSLHHLAHIGHMLGGDVQSALPIWTYLQIRNILTVLADFLDKIESDRMITTGLAEKLRTQIRRIDDCMKQGSSGEQEAGLLSMGKSLLPNWHSFPSARSPGSTDRPYQNRSPQSNTTATFGTTMQMQSLVQERMPAAAPSSVLSQHNANYSSTSTLGMMIPPVITSGTQTYGLVQNSDPFQVSGEPQIETSDNSMAETIFSGELFANWPYSMN